MLTAAKHSTNSCDFALVTMLGLLGLRIFEATGSDIDDLREEHGHRVLRVRGKGDKVVLVPLPPAAGRAIERAIDDRTTGPILLTRRGTRMDRHCATRRLRRLAEDAGVKLPRMHPHMLRHTFVTTMLDAGVDLRDVQIAARHADPRTTMRYDRARKNLDRHPNYISLPTWPREPDLRPVVPRSGRKQKQFRRAPSVEPSSMAHRRMVVNRLLAALVLPPLLAACSSVHATHSTADDHGASLSQDEVAKAETIARGVIADQGTTVTSASVVARPGTVKDSNTGHPCTSGRELRIRLIGKFPHTVTTGHPVEPGVPTPDFTVRAMNVTADAESGLACLIGVQTSENGKVKPLPGSTMLSVQAE